MPSANKAQRPKQVFIGDYPVPSIIYHDKSNSFLTPGEILGQGAFGMVFATEYKGERRALKVQRKSSVAIAEYRLHGSLKHDHVVEVVESFETVAFLFMIMERCAKPLWAPPTAMPSLSLHLAKKVLKGVVLGLHFLHQRNILHRDIKPQNILLTAMGAKIADLGLALQDVSKPRMRGMGGTPAYMAPEVEKRERYGLCADLFSLGVMAHEMISGVRGTVGVCDL
ncbi:hypothetical protein BGZ95_007744, partial [Linnemannia exigua]